MTEIGLAALNPPIGVDKLGSIGQPIAGFAISIRDDQDGSETRRRCRRAVSGSTSPHADARLLERSDGDRRGRSRRLARHRRRREGRRGRLPLVLRPQEADHRPRRLQHHAPGGRGGAARASRRWRAPAWSASTTSCTARTCAPTSTLKPECEAADRRRADPIRPRTGRLQGARGDRLPRRDAAQPDRQGRPRRAEENSQPATTPITFRSAPLLAERFETGSP